MADFRISQLPELGEGDVALDDVLPLTDVSASETKKIKVQNLITDGVAAIPDGSISLSKVDLTGGTLDGGSLEPGSITGGPGGKIADSTIQANNMADASIVDAAIVGVHGAKLVDASVDSDKLATGIDGAKIADGSLTSSKFTGTFDGVLLQEGSIGTAVLADGAVTTPKLAAEAVTSEKVAPGLSGGKLSDASVTDAKLAAGIDGAKIAEGTIASSKLTGTFDGALLAEGSIQTVGLADGAVTTPKLATEAVTSDKVAPGLSGGKLSDDSVTSAKIANLDGAKLTADSVTSAKLATNIDGAKIATGTLENEALAGGITGEKLAPATVTSDKIQSVDGTTILEGTVAADRLNEATLNRSIDLDDSGNLGIANTIVAGTTSGITYNAQGLITATEALAGTDLPVATEIAIGAVSIPVGGGLQVTGTGELSIEDVIVATTASGITVNSKGQVTILRPLVSSDLPIATDSSIGGVSVPTDGGLTVDNNGAVRFKTSTVGPGPHTKIVCDTFGTVVSSEALTDNDLPGAISADKITLGKIASNQIDDNAVLSRHLSDYTTCLMQEDFPGSSTDYYLGMLWWQPSTSQLRVYARGSAGNQWSPVGFGALQANNLRWGGTFNANDGTVSIVTDFGKTAGLEVGAQVPAPTDDLSGLYLICQTEGNGISYEAVNGVNFNAGDWLLCINEVQGYTQIDMGGTGGGGGGASVLNDLLDVTIGTATGGVSLADRQLLEYDGGNGVWRNMAEIDGGSF